MRSYRSMEGSISRATIIFSLNNLVDEGVLDYHEESGKGGMYKVYKLVALASSPSLRAR
jgi:predicted transcriptional regulator